MRRSRRRRRVPTFLPGLWLHPPCLIPIELYEELVGMKGGALHGDQEPAEWVVRIV